MSSGRVAAQVFTFRCTHNYTLYQAPFGPHIPVSSHYTILYLNIIVPHHSIATIAPTKATQNPGSTVQIDLLDPELRPGVAGFWRVAFNRATLVTEASDGAQAEDVFADSAGIGVFEILCDPSHDEGAVEGFAVAVDVAVGFTHHPLELMAEVALWSAEELLASEQTEETVAMALSIHCERADDEAEAEQTYADSVEDEASVVVDMPVIAEEESV